MFRLSAIRKWWQRVWCRHHFHNMGPIELARCGGTLRYDWECCMCDDHTRSYYESHADTMFGTSISPREEKELQRKHATS